MDLSDFARLKVLRVASGLVFDDEEPGSDPERKGFYKLLPSSLVVLDVSAARTCLGVYLTCLPKHMYMHMPIQSHTTSDFNFNSSILNLDRNEGQKTFNEQRPQLVESEKWKYAWLQELGEHAAESLPQLRKVSVKERWKHPRGFAHVPFRWALPGYLEALFEKSGVEVEVWLRRPRDYDER